MALLRLAVAGLAAAMLIACGQQSPDQLLASAKNYLAKGDRSAAVIQLKNLLTKAPNNGEARLLLGQALLDDEDFVSAEKELLRAIELKQPHEKAVPAYVRALLAQGKNQAVIAEVEKYKLFDPGAVAATQTALGDALMQLGNRSRAREAYAAALAAVPGYPRARLGEAMAMALEGQVDEALRQIDEVIGADPKLADARAARADILLVKGDRPGARKSLEEAIAANERYLPARLTLIRMLTTDGDFDGAARLLASTRKLTPANLQVTYLDAVLAFRRGETERARQLTQQLLKYVPDLVPALVLNAALDVQDGRFAAAESTLRKVVAQAPGHLGARLLLLQTYLRAGQPGRARELLQPLVEKGFPANPQLLLLAGETFLANGDLKGATALFEAAAKGPTPQEMAARIRLGQIALAAGRSEQGFAELEAVSEMDAAGYQADLALIAGHLRRNEIDRAMSAVQVLEKKQPKNPLTFQMYGMVNLAKKDLEAARKSFERALELQPDYLPAAQNLAQLDLLQKKPEEARKRYEALIAKVPNNEQLYMALSDLQLRTGAAPKDVAVTLQRAVKANPQAPAPRLALISLQLRAGETKAALTSAQDALAVMPSDTRVLDAAGVAQEAAGEVNQAIGTYNKLASLQPQSVQPLFRLAALHVRQMDTDNAIEALRRAQKVAPHERDVVPQLVQVYIAAGRQEEALKEARGLQKREPKFAGGWSLEGDIQMSQHKFAEAEGSYREALKREPRSGLVAVKLHGALSAAGRAADADAWARRWIAENPKDPEMHLYLGARDLAAKNLKGSAAHYQAVLAIDPNNAMALNDLAWIGGQLGDAKAIGYAERAVKLAPNNAAVLDTYGMLLLKKGDAEKALPVLARATRIAPARSDIRLNYAKALIKSGRKGDARKELESLQAFKENFAGKDEVAGLLKGL